jgi:Mg2+-importing ATPase
MGFDMQTLRPVADELPQLNRSVLVASWLLEAAALVAVIRVSLHFSELETLGRVLIEVKAGWLLSACALQYLTYAAQRQIFSSVFRAAQQPLKL